MRLTRKAAYRNRREEELVSPESSHFMVSFPRGEKMVVTFKGKEAPTTSKYTMHLTIRDLRELFMRPLMVPDSEKELWQTFFKLWTKRVKKKLDP